MLDNSLKKQAKAREAIMALIVILLICYAGYANFYTPKRKKLVELNAQIKEIVDKKTGIEKLNKALKQKYEQAKSEVKHQAKMAETLDPRIRMLKEQENSEYRNINEFLKRVTNVDFVSRLHIKSLKYDLPVKKTGYKETRFYLTASGRFVNIIEFLEKLENIPALISLDAMEIRSNTDNSDQVVLDIKGYFYYLGSDNA